MGSPATRIGDKQTGHGCFPPVPLAAGSNNVYVNNIPVGRIGDAYNPHCCGGCHTDLLTSGSSSVYVNNIPVSRIGDSAGPAKAAEGSPNVIIGG